VFANRHRHSFGEAEVITASIKVLCFVVLIIVSLVITLGGAPDHDRIGFRYWTNPGAFTDFNGITGATGHFLGFFSAFINASFSFIGVETVRGRGRGRGVWRGRGARIVITICSLIAVNRSSSPRLRRRTRSDPSQRQPSASPTGSASSMSSAPCSSA
jgi:hypothetical protein